MNVQITLFDVIISSLYFFAFLLFFIYIYLTRRNKNKVYNFIVSGYIFKVISAVFFLLIYLYYYKGGDTIGYYKSGVALVNLLFKYPKVYFSILFGNVTPENLSYFDINTGFPAYTRDIWSFTVVRIISIFVLLGFKGILATTILVATFSYSGVWMLYKFLTSHYPSLYKEFALAVLFFPSVAFWGSGILKDSFTLTASYFMFVALFQVLLYRKKVILNIVFIVISFWVLIKIKPYVFFQEILALSAVLIYIFLKRIRIRFLRVVLFPVIIGMVMMFGWWTYSTTAEVAGGFYSSVNDVLEAIVVKQRDLTQDYYGGNSFNIGYFDPTVPGILSKFVPATIAGIFRPFLWESHNMVMLLSGVETFLLLLFSLWVFFKLFMFFLSKGFKIFSFLDDPFIIYSLVYSILFAFMVGLVTANFGALVRYRIPLISFYLIFLLIVNKKINRAKKVSDNQ